MCLCSDCQSVADTPQVDDGDIRIVAQMFSQLVDVAVERIAVVIVGVLPHKFHQFR